MDPLTFQVTQTLPPRTLRRLVDLQSQLSRAALNRADETGASEPGTRAKLAAALIVAPAQAGVQSLAVAGQGLDQIRRMIVPDALVSVIGDGLLGAVRPSRFSFMANGRSKADTAATTQAEAPPDPRIEKLRLELEDIIARSCPLCELSIASLDRPFVGDNEEEI